MRIIATLAALALLTGPGWAEIHPPSAGASAHAGDADPRAVEQPDDDVDAPPDPSEQSYQERSHDDRRPTRSHR